MKRLSFDRQQLDKVLNEDYSKEKLIALFEKDFFSEFSADVGVWEKYTLKDHIFFVLKQFERYFGHKQMPAHIDKGFFRVLLVLHDIGKPRAITEGDKDKQHEYTPRMLKYILKELEFSDAEIKIAMAFVTYDPIGHYLKRGNLEECRKALPKMHKSTGLTFSDFWDFLLVYFMSDAGSYTEDSGGLKSLDYQFVFDHDKNEMRLAPETKKKVDELRAGF